MYTLGEFYTSKNVKVLREFTLILLKNTFFHHVPRGMIYYALLITINTHVFVEHNVTLLSSHHSQY
jgi:hypothetical protein